MGFKSPPEQTRKSGLQQFSRLFDRFRPKKRYFRSSSSEAHDREGLENLHLSDKNRALDCRSWYDEDGARRFPSFATLKEAEAFQKQKSAEFERHREGRFSLDDREMLSQARDLASRQRIHRPSKFRSGTVRKAPAKPGRWARSSRIPDRQIEPICGIHGQAQRRYASFSGTFCRQPANRPD